MAISAVITFRPRDGRLGEQMENLKGIKRFARNRHPESAGGRTAGGTNSGSHRQTFGTQINTLVAVSEVQGLERSQRRFEFMILNRADGRYACNSSG